MTYQATEGKHPSIRHGLKPVMESFRQAAEAEPDLLMYGSRREAQVVFARPDEDPFGDLARCAFLLFMDKAQDYIKDHVDNLESYGEYLELRRKFIVSQLGIGVIALFSEAAPLVRLRDVPGEELSPEQTVQLTANSYSFIEKILQSGSRIGASIAQVYIQPDQAEGTGWYFEGAILNGGLTHPERLDRFVLNRDNGEERVEPIGIDHFIGQWREDVKRQNLDNPVHCPAGIYNDPETGAPYARSLFDVMINHAKNHIYPNFLPMARAAIETERAAGRISIIRANT